MHGVRRREDASTCPRGRGCSPKTSVWLSLCVLVLLPREYSSQITVTQTPSKLVSKVNQNVTLACRFTHTPDRGVSGVILYWYRPGPNKRDIYTYPNSQARQEYKNRVLVLDPSRTSENKSVVLLNASWADRSKHHCKLSYETTDGPEMKLGAGVQLLLHDSMTFDRVPDMESHLLCSVRVSPDPWFHLSVFLDGVRDDQVRNHTHGPHVTLSLLVPLLEDVTYECRLSHGSDLILSQTYALRALPEPILLYAAILLVPFIILVIFLTALLVIKSRN